MSKKILLAISLLLCLSILAACDQTDTDDTSDSTPDNSPTVENNEGQDQSDTAYTLEQVSEHNTSEDCWLVYESDVYNVTDFIANHPGGAAITEGCGTDATDLFETRPMGSGSPHSSYAHSLLDDYYIGDLTI